MCSWDSYITTLMDGNAQDAAIVGYESGKESVWAAHKGGGLAKITPEEIRKLVTSDRSSFYGGGVSVAGTMCTVLRDGMFQEGQYTLDLRTKVSEQESVSVSMSVGKAQTCLVIVKGKEGVTGGTLNAVVYKTVEYLRTNGI
ncbi:hypothetical protein AAFF_G00156510 [Aldrovandia affinis]|uniref:Profilin n=1 Tax=Aldrovandia affinis TaxID=143900 RepID=A0AAD7RN82_9TELE|nr:hypothetical protein AAFF_G00156510 [Aldrovandia affinis]